MFVHISAPLHTQINETPLIYKSNVTRVVFCMLLSQYISSNVCVVLFVKTVVLCVTIENPADAATK